MSALVEIVDRPGSHGAGFDLPPTRGTAASFCKTDSPYSKSTRRWLAATAPRATVRHVRIATRPAVPGKAAGKGR